MAINSFPINTRTVSLDQILAAEGYADAAEAARDSSFANAKGAATIADARALVADGETFIVYAAGAQTFDAYRRLTSTTQVLLGTYPTAASVLLARVKALDWLVTIDDGAGGLLTPVFQYEASLGLVWQNGAVRTVADALTDHGDGSFTLNAVPAGLTAGATALVEWSREGHSGDPSGTLWGMINNPVTLAGGMSFGANWQAATEVTGATLENRMSATVESHQMRRWGSTRAIGAVPASGNSKRLIDGGEVIDGLATSSYLTPTMVTIGRAPRNTAVSVIANISVTRVVIFSGSLSADQIRALNDAAERMDMTPQDRWPNWLAAVPDGNGGYILPDLQFDPKRKRCWWRGREREIDDVMIEVTPNDWIVKRGPRLTSTSGSTVVVDTQPTEYYAFASQPSGMVAHYSNVTVTTHGQNARVEMNWEMANAETPPPGGLLRMTGFIAPASTFLPVRGPSLPSSMGSFEVGLARGQGILRHGRAVPATGSVLSLQDAYPVATGSTVSAYSPQDYFRFGNAFGGTQSLQNCELEQVIIYDRSLTKAQLEWVGRFNEYGADPLMFISDSLNNVAMPAEALRLHSARAGLSYIPLVSGGRGSRGLSYFAEFIAEWIDEYQPDAADYLLVLVEGGLDYSSLALDGVTTVGPYSERDIQTYLRQIFEKFRNPRAVIMEPNSNRYAEVDIDDETTVNMTALRLSTKNMSETYPDYWCPIMSLFQAQAANDAEYDAIRADGRAPPALRGDGIHPSWGSAFSSDPSTGNGYYWLSLAIFRHLMARGWLKR
jgi:hypothetical protein